VTEAEAEAEPAWEWVEPEDFFVAHVAGRDRAFWLDGSGARPWSGRRSVVGWLEPDELSLTYDAAAGVVLAHRDGRAEPAGSDLFAVLGDAPRTSGRPGSGHARWVGFFGYAARPDLPARLGTPALGHGQEGLDGCWLRVRRCIVFDHATRQVRVLAPAAEGEAWAGEVGRLLSATMPTSPVGAAPPAHVVATCSPADYAVAFDRVQHELRLGNSYEVNLTYRTVVASAEHPLTAYRRLRRINPAPYAAFLTHCGSSLLSAPPERFATVTADRRIETRPIKGTTARDPDPLRDREAALRLRREPKFVGENLMIVDLLRNDMSQVCELGTVRVTDLMHVESYPSVHQLVTTIEGRLRAGGATVGALRAMFPGGSMTGAPKLRTMEIISDVESTPRGPYAGAVGWLVDDGSADLGVIIRTLVHRDGHYTLGTGGGVTVRSDRDEEFAEAAWKADRLLQAVGLPG
jgi:para-aminobenzoate synthetase